MGGVWMLTAAVAVIAVWALLEMIRWHIRHNRIQRQLAEVEGKLNELGRNRVTKEDE